VTTHSFGKSVGGRSFGGGGGAEPMTIVCVTLLVSPPASFTVNVT